MPLLVDHDPEQEIGRVHQLVEWNDLDGPWLVARANVTDPPGWLKRGTKASFGFKAPRCSSFVPDYIYGGYVTEVTVCSASHKPKEPLAEVVVLERAALRPDRFADVEIIHPAPVIRRRARNLDEELLEWWRAAPEGLDDATWEQLLTVLQRRHHGPWIHDVYAGVR